MKIEGACYCGAVKFSSVSHASNPFWTAIVMVDDFKVT